MWRKIFSPIAASKCAKKTFTTLSNFTGTLQSIELPTLDLNEERRQFEQVFPEYLSSLMPNFTEPCFREVLNSHRTSIEYNVHMGKKNRGLATVLTYKMMASSGKLGPREMHLARIMGWNMEMLQAHFLMLDDIQDQSHTRRGKPCWFRRENVGLHAINDGTLLYFAIFTILRKYFRDKQYYVPVMQLFHDAAARTTFGQNLDGWKIKFSEFTHDRFETIAKYKTGYYTFYLPVAAAIHMAGMPQEAEREDLERVLLHMGYFFQVQDDFLDCYGDPAVTGKIGTDIAERKCTWLVVKALENASAEQIRILQENYGQRNEKSAAEVRKVYDELCLKNMFYSYETDVYTDLLQRIHQFDNINLQHVMLYMLNFLYKRNR